METPKEARVRLHLRPLCLWPVKPSPLPCLSCKMESETYYKKRTRTPNSGVLPHRAIKKRETSHCVQVALLGESMPATVVTVVTFI